MKYASVIVCINSRFIEFMCIPLVLCVTVNSMKCAKICMYRLSYVILYIKM
jgi:hypothetical protein